MKSEINFVSDLLKKLGVSARLMNTEEIEDYGMLMMMKEVDRTKKISREAVMKKLKR